MAAKPSEDPNKVKGQIELLRENALGNFRDLLVAVAKDTAMLVWLDGRTNVRNRPQENFARELMELFTMGVGTFAEEDVYAGARVFTGWNLTRPSNAYYTFNYVAGQHDTTAKEFTFPIYPDGNTDDPGAYRRRWHAGRRGSDHRGRRASGNRSAARAQALRVLRQRGGSSLTPGLIAELSRHLLRERIRDEAGHPAPAALAAVHGCRRTATRGIRGRRSSSRDRSRKSAGRDSR